MEMENILKNYAELHLHSEHSSDSVLKIEEVVKKADKMGLSALALTNHGNLIGNTEFLNAKKFLQKREDGSYMNLIPGVEIYVEKERYHMILLAKNYEGYLKISKIVTKSNSPENLETSKNGKVSFPVTTIDILKEAYAKIMALSNDYDTKMQELTDKNLGIEEQIKHLRKVKMNFIYFGIILMLSNWFYSRG